MRRPHVYQRSAPRAPGGHSQADSRTAVIRTLAAQLGTMIDKADAVGEAGLGDLLDAARLEAERMLADEEPSST